jgi:hypothetical protein
MKGSKIMADEVKARAVYTAGKEAWKKEEQELMCVLKEPELVVKGELLTQEMEKLNDLEAQGKAIKERAKESESVIRKHQQAVLYKQELRTVECELVPDYEHSSVDVYRLDTGAFVSRREMKFHEKQQELPLGDTNANHGICECGHGMECHDDGKGACDECTCEMYEVAEAEKAEGEEEPAAGAAAGTEPAEGAGAGAEQGFALVQEDGQQADNPFWGGNTYLYATPNEGEREIGVTKGLGDDYIVAWITDSGAKRRVKSPHLQPGLYPNSLQHDLDLFAAKRGLKSKRVA